MSSATMAMTPEQSNEHFATVFASTGAMAIFRGFDPAQTVSLCRSAWSAGVDVVEIPIQGTSGLRALEAAVAAAAEVGRRVGSGTVVSLQLLRAAVDAGAAFTVAPGLDEEVALASLDLAVPHLPGVATSSEIQHARRLGLVWLKAFPAAQLTAGWFAAQRAPFPDVQFVATGGISAANAASFLAAGARAVALASALSDPAQLRELDETGVIHRNTPDGRR
jgi:2-dehydro-3-deoxyphosphogluconate aldolase / (4S)-4-hydroxy-2-oxoglutarate aldolase